MLDGHNFASHEVFAEQARQHLDCVTVTVESVSDRSFELLQRFLARSNKAHRRPASMDESEDQSTHALCAMTPPDEL